MEISGKEMTPSDFELSNKILTEILEYFFWMTPTHSDSLGARE